MTNTKQFIDHLYSAFNQRHIDEVLSHMTEDVSWPKASEGGRIQGKEEIRFYWKRQWGQFNAQVEPLEVTERNGTVEVTVRQLVKSLKGEVISDTEVQHVYTIQNGLIQRMEQRESEKASVAFHKNG